MKRFVKYQKHQLDIINIFLWIFFCFVLLFRFLGSYHEPPFLTRMMTMMKRMNNSRSNYLRNLSLMQKEV